MVIDDPKAYETVTEVEMMERLLPLEGARVIELGCGAAWITRQLAQRYPNTGFTATEVDQQQHEKNLQLSIPENLSFVFAGAEAIDVADGSIDIVWMLKSLHHVPEHLLSKAMQEIVRVLKPGGLAYFSEPVYSGSFNDLMRLVHDEKAVRERAFNALCGLVESGAMDLKGEYFFNVPGCYESWQQFEDRFLNITHTKLSIDQARYAEIRQRFLSHMGPKGAEFLKPHRVDLLQKPL
jgi:ubiquinone/menaquinone biosynthesis C-methylase UbiE